MVDTRDSKSRATERGGSSPLQGIMNGESFNEQFQVESVLIDSTWNWNKFSSGSRNLGDLLYLMNEESALKSSALHPPRVYVSTGITQR